MSISALHSAVSGYAPAQPLPKIAPEQAAPRKQRDSFELSYGNLLSAEKEGYIEVGGRRFTVSGEMAARLRATYEETRARNEAKLVRQAAEHNARAAEQQAKAVGEETDSMMKAMEIMRRIAKGGRVPPEDERFLMEFSEEMYMSAKMQALMAKEHEEYDSVLGGEEESAEADGEIEEIGSGAEHVEVSVSDGAVDGVSAAAASE